MYLDALLTLIDDSVALGRRNRQSEIDQSQYRMGYSRYTFRATLIAGSFSALCTHHRVNCPVRFNIAENRFDVLACLREWNRLYKLVHAVVGTSGLPIDNALV